MTTFLGPSLAEVASGQKIPESTLAFFRERIRIKLHQLILREWVRWEKETGLTRRELSARIDKRPEQITRYLGAPANLTLDTVSDLLVGLGVEPTFGSRSVIEAHAIDQNATTMAEDRIAARMIPAPAPNAEGATDAQQAPAKVIDILKPLVPRRPPRPRALFQEDVQGQVA